MNPSDVPNLRLVNQHIEQQNFKTVSELVSWMGAMQAQDYEMMKWAIGVRLPGVVSTGVEEAIDRGEIIRTHLMRPTWHIVSADNIYWMLELTRPRIQSSLVSRHRQLEITPAIVRKCNKLIVKTIEENRGNATREEIISGFKNAKIDLEGNRAAHLLMLAELDGLICSGKNRNKKPTYALLEDRVPKTKPLKNDEALEKLARKYFTSHGPAALEDFIWWSGLRVTDAKKALEMIKHDFVSETFESMQYWLSATAVVSDSTDRESLHLLPAFDEYVISYKYRNTLMFDGHQQRAISGNGVFYPVIVVNGLVKGIWKRTIKKDKVIVETDLLQSPSKKEKKLLDEKARLFGDFLGKKAEISSIKK